MSAKCYHFVTDLSFFCYFFDFFTSSQPIKIFNICVRLVGGLGIRKSKVGG